MNAITLTPGEIYQFDISKLYSPSELQAIERHNDSVFQEARRRQQAEIEEHTRQAYESNRPMSGEEYYQFALDREDQKQRKQKEEELLAAAKEQERIDFMESEPPSFELVDGNAMMFLKTLQEWIQRGYTIDLNRIFHFVPGCFAVRLIRSVPT